MITPLTVILNAVKDLIVFIIKSVRKKEDRCLIIFVSRFCVNVGSFVPKSLSANGWNDKQPELLGTISLTGYGISSGLWSKEKPGTSVQKSR